MKRLIQVVLLISVFSNAFSQIDERVFFQIGGTVGADYSASKGAIGVKNINVNQSYTNTQINYASVIFGSRINFMEFSNNSSMSLALKPTLSMGRAYNDIGGGSNLSLRVPVFMELNFGAASTVSTRKDVGFAIGFGMQYVRYPLLKGVPVAKDLGTKAVTVNAHWFEPVVDMGIKFFGKHYYCREVNLRASYASIKEVDNSTAQAPDQVIKGFTNMGFMLSFSQYINY
jgi:hypothetical protein